MKKQLLVLSLLTAVTLPATASNFYALGDIGSTTFEADGASESDTSFDLGAGYSLNQHFAVELAARKLGGWGESDSYSGFESGYSYTADYSLNADVNTLQLSVVGKYPMNEAISLFGRLGFAKLTIKTSGSMDLYFPNLPAANGPQSIPSDSESKNKSVIGFGADFKMSDKFAVRLDYQQYGKWDGLAISTATIGGTYSF
jgi:opacity protein-like surface antigen